MMSYETDAGGVFRPTFPVSHRNEEYPESGFDSLLEMQSAHFWYRGRHKFLLKALARFQKPEHLDLIDLGGGVGGWVNYLRDNTEVGRYASLALGDSSQVAVAAARRILPDDVQVYHLDLMKLGWTNRWDVIFLLDVIEHCPDDVAILKQARAALKPGGLLIVSTPALMYFWSHNDDYSRHLRRYNISDYAALSEATGFELLDARYFMFFLSPLYWLSRKGPAKPATEDELQARIRDEHRVPNKVLNFLLTKVFNAESPIGHRISFPWGTSVLGVFENKI